MTIQIRFWKDHKMGKIFEDRTQIFWIITSTILVGVLGLVDFLTGLVYLDLDNFKQVNDKLGHDEGDKLIGPIASDLKGQLRNTDIVARLGGDEFAILFPETGQKEAQVVMSKVYSHVQDQLRQKYAFVTFSAGAVTYVAIPNSSSEAIKIADELMYSVKNSTKNGIHYSLYTG